jgi:very-short-patch-repair endonuclease
MVWALARLQHGVVAGRQLRELGYGKKAIAHRVANGRLHRVGFDVFAVGRPEVTGEGRWMAAVLACGPGAALSHASAGELLGLCKEGQEVEVSVRTCTPRRQRGVVVHRRAGLEEHDVIVCRGIPVTAAVRTLVDLSASSALREIERLVNDADKLDLVDPDGLRSALGRYRGQRGVARLRAVLDRHSFRYTESGLERRFLRLLDAARLPPPETQEKLGAFRVDFIWPRLGLIVETDSLRYHRTQAAQARDRLRDQTHAMAGLTTLRFTHGQLRHEGPRVLGTMRAVIRRLEAGSSPE